MSKASALSAGIGPHIAFLGSAEASCLSSGNDAHKTDRRVLRTRRAIRDAFHELVVERGLDNVTISELARRADIDRKTFYLHYDSVYDLVNHEANELLGRALAAVEATKSSEMSADTAPEVEIRAFFGEVNAILEEDLELYRRIASSFSIEFVMGIIREPLERAMYPHLKESGLSAAEIDLLCRLYVSGAVIAYGSWLREGGALPIERVADLVTHALATAYRSLALPAKSVAENIG